MARVFHVTTRADWEAARRAGHYAPPSLAEEGFIHFSDPGQVLTVANARFAGVEDLVLLCVPAERLELKYELGLDSTDYFPHLYSPLDVDAVADVLPFEEGEDGFVLPPGVGPAAT